MKKKLLAWAAAAVLGITAGASAQTQPPSSHPRPRQESPAPSRGYLIWPGWPWHPEHPDQWRPIFPRPRPPAVQLRYTVYYRWPPYGAWQVYAHYRTHADAETTARWLRSYGYETDVVVTYR